MRCYEFCAVKFLVRVSFLPGRIEPFLRKCFDGVEKLDFSDDFDVVGMISAVGEELRLCERVDAGVHTASVEKWLAQLEKIMRSSIKRVIANHSSLVTNPPNYPP